MPRTPEEVRLPSRRRPRPRRRSCAHAARLLRFAPPTTLLNRPSARCWLAQEAALDVKVKEALDCPCVADLRNSSCGTHFTTGARLQWPGVVLRGRLCPAPPQPSRATCARRSPRRAPTAPRFFWRCRRACDAHQPRERRLSDAACCPSQACMSKHAAEFAAFSAELAANEAEHAAQQAAAAANKPT